MQNIAERYEKIDIPQSFIDSCKALYTQQMDVWINHKNIEYKKAGERLREIIESIEDKPHFWFLLARRVMRADKNSGNMLRNTPDTQDRFNFVLELLRETFREYHLEELAKTDALTGLPNRRQFEADYTLLAEGEKDTVSVCVFIDLDKLKQANDLLGHIGADMLLVKVGEKLQEGTKKHMSEYTPKIYRFGGDEMGLLLSISKDAMINDIVQIIGKVLSEVTKEDYNIEGKRWSQSLSCGSVFTTQKEMMGSKTNILRLADEGQYLAKTTRGDEVRNKPANEISSELEQAIRRTRHVDRGSSRWVIVFQRYPDQKITDISETNFVFSQD